MWDFITDKILAETGANFSPLSPSFLLLAYQSVAKSVTPFSEPSFNIQRHFILQHFLKTFICLVAHAIDCALTFKCEIYSSCFWSISNELLCSPIQKPFSEFCCSIHLNAKACLEFHTPQSLLVCCSTQCITQQCLKISQSPPKRFISRLKTSITIQMDTNL